MRQKKRALKMDRARVKAEEHMDEKYLLSTGDDSFGYLFSSTQNPKSPFEGLIL
jgi:hypothetical protein